MGNFKEIGDSKLVSSKYSGRAIVYLESYEDYQIFFERWFYDEGEHLEFRSSDSGSGGGCTKVIKDVETDRNNDIVSFGIVDRDALLQQRKWSEFWETDDLKFMQMKPFGDNIRPLCRWEIENYLLDIDEIEMLLADIGKGSPRKIREKSVVINDLLNHCQALIPIMACNILKHSKGQEAVPMKFCIEDTGRKPIENKIKQKIDESDKSQYDDILLKIESFQFGSDDLTEDNFNAINRIIDGKRLFERLKRHNQLIEDYRFLLARRIKERDKIDTELTEMIDIFKRAI